LHKDPCITQRRVSAEIGLSLGTVNYCLKKLTVEFIACKEKEYQRIKQEIIMLKKEVS
jgi:predicted transcriptional regulator